MQKARPCFSARIWFGRILRQQRVQGRGRTFLNRFSAYMLVRARYKGTPRGAKRFKFVLRLFHLRIVFRLPFAALSGMLLPPNTGGNFDARNEESEKGALRTMGA